MVLKDQQNFQDPNLQNEVKFSPEFTKALKQLINAMQNQWSQYFNYEQFSQKFNLHQQAFLALMVNFVDHFNKIDDLDDWIIELFTDINNLNDDDDLDYYQNKYFIDDDINYDDLYDQLKDIESEYQDEINDLLQQNREILKDIFKQSQISKSKSLGK